MVLGQAVLVCVAGVVEPAAATTPEAAAVAAVLAASRRQYAQPKSTTSPRIPKRTGMDNVMNRAAWPRWECTPLDSRSVKHFMSVQRAGASKTLLSEVNRGEQPRTES